MRKKLFVFGLGAVAMVIALVVGVAAGMGRTILTVPEIDQPIGTVTKEAKDTRVVQSIVREQQVVLLSLGIQGIHPIRTATAIWGIEIPGSDRATFIKYSFTAKLGVEGGEVEVKELGEKIYRITIPEFKFIGHDDVAFELAVEQNGALSWITPKQDTLGAASKILDEEGRQVYLSQNDATLRDQAEFFYTRLVLAIQPDASVKVVFSGGDN